MAIFETMSSFHVKQRNTRKLQFLLFSTFLLVLTNFSKVLSSLATNEVNHI